MGWANKLIGWATGNGVEVDSTNRMLVNLAQVTAPAQVGAVRAFGENDAGYITGLAKLASPEVDVDYRMRVAQDLILDDVVFNYTAQDTGKHSYLTTTLTNAWTVGQMTTNSASTTAVNSGSVFQTYAYFPNVGTQTLSADVEVGFSALPNANSFVEFGLMLPGAQTAAPTDGVFLRLSAAGLQGVASSNGTEVSTGLFFASAGTGVWTYALNQKYQFIIYVGGVDAEFWVDDGTGAVKLGAITKPTAWNRICMSQGLPFAIKHRIVGGAAGSVMQAQVGAYNVRLGGSNLTSTVSTQGNRTYGSYQGVSGTIGQLANYANNVNPTPAVPTNTTAALGVGLGGQFWETPTLAVNTDGIICSYQVPLGTVSVPGRRLVIRGISLMSHVAAAVTGGPFVKQYILAFGHTTVSLATAEAAAAKAPRRVPLPGFTQVVTAAQAVSTSVSQPGGAYMDFGDAPIFVNPGEFVAIASKNIGTIATAGTLGHIISFVYGWE